MIGVWWVAWWFTTNNTLPETNIQPLQKKAFAKIDEIVSRPLIFLGLCLLVLGSVSVQKETKFLKIYTTCWKPLKWTILKFVY